MTWSSDTVARLREAWDEGLTQQQIADELGITRSAAAGKVHRLHLSRRIDPNAARVRSLRKPRTGDYVPVAARTPDAPTNAPVGIIELTSHHCRFPVDIDGEPLHYCGAEVVEGSWCPYHSKVVYMTYKRRSEAQREHLARMHRASHKARILRAGNNGA